MTKPKKKVAAKPRRRVERPQRALHVSGEPLPIQPADNVSVRVHALKIYPEHFKELANQADGVHLTRYDRDFRENDFIVFRSFEPRTGYGPGVMTLRIARMQVLGDLPEAAGLKPGHIVLHLRRLGAFGDVFAACHQDGRAPA